MDEIWFLLAEYISIGFYCVLLTAWRALPLGLCALAIDLALHRRVAARYLVLVWMLVAVRLLLPFSLPSPWSMQGPLDRALAALESRLATPPVKPAPLAAQVSGDVLALASEPMPQPATGPAPALNRIDLLIISGMASYGLVAGALVLRSLIAHSWFAYRLRSCQRVEDMPFVDLMLHECDALHVAHRPVVKIVPELSTPAVFGLFRPTICLPEDARSTLSEQELRWVLRHELAHVQRRDAWLLALVSLVRAIHWLNPLAWLVAARVRTHIENAADDQALCAAPPHDAVAYGRLLLRLAEQVSPARPSAALGFLQFVAGKRLQQRIENATRPRTRVRRWLGWAFTAALLGLAFVGWTDAATKRTQSASPMWSQSPMGLDPQLNIHPSLPALTDDGPTTLRTYDVSEVIERIRNEDPAQDASLLLRSLGPLLSPGREFQIHDNRLLAEATTRQHAALAQMLEAWRISGPQEIAIELRMLSAHQKFASSIDWIGASVTGLDLRGAQPALAAKAAEPQLRAFMVGMQGDPQSNILFAPKMTLFNGQTATISAETKRPFVTAVAPIAQNAFQPIIEVLSEGLIATMNPIVSADGSVALTFDLQISKIGDVALANLPYGSHDGKTGTTVQVPSATTKSVRGTVQLTQGESLVIAMPELYDEKQPAGAERAVYYALTPRVLDWKEIKPLPMPPREQEAK